MSQGLCERLFTSCDLYNNLNNNMWAPSISPSICNISKQMFTNEAARKKKIVID